MSLTFYLDKGASLGVDAPCLVTADGDRTLSYGDVVEHSHRVAAALAAAGVNAGDKVAILSGNDPVAFATVFGIARRGAVWCRSTHATGSGRTGNCWRCSTASRCSTPRPTPTWSPRCSRGCPRRTVVPLAELDGWLAGGAGTGYDPTPPDDTVLIVGTGGTTGRPKGVQLVDRNIEEMTALTLMGYPFEGRPVYLAMAPLTHAAGVLCFPIMALGGQVVVMSAPDPGGFLENIERHRVTHTFLPPTVIYMVLGHERLAGTDLSSLQCFWYGAAPMSPARLEQALTDIGPVMAQIFGQSEAPMMIWMMPPSAHFHPDGSVAVERLTSAGRPGPLVAVGIMAEDGSLVPNGERGEIVVRSSLVMRGYYKDPEATAEASRFGWHHTGDIGYLDDDGYLYIVDRGKDMVITGGFNVYSAEVEQALMAHPAVRDCGVVGLPDDRWGERVVAVIEAQPGAETDPAEIIGFVKERLGSVKAPKEVLTWPDLPRSTVGKVLKTEIKDRLKAEPAASGR